MAYGPARLSCGPLDVFIGDYQWGFTDERSYLARPFGATDYGSAPRQTYGRSLRRRTVKFTKTEALMDQFRRLSYYAGQGARQVLFYPAYVTDPESFWILDWPSGMEITWIIENREEVEIVAAEAAL